MYFIFKYLYTYYNFVFYIRNFIVEYKLYICYNLNVMLQNIWLRALTLMLRMKLHLLQCVLYVQMRFQHNMFMFKVITLRS